MQNTFKIGRYSTWLSEEDPKDLARECIPPMVRRRCSQLTRVALHVASACLKAAEQSANTVRTVFASRHGEQGVTLELLKSVDAKEPLSPMRFSGSVHNTASGYFSITNENELPTTSIAARTDTFRTGLIEAASTFCDSPDNPVLYVIADEPPPGVYEEIVDEPPFLYGAAFLLERGEDFDLTSLSSREWSGSSYEQVLEFVKEL